MRSSWSLSEPEWCRWRRGRSPLAWAGSFSIAKSITFQICAGNPHLRSVSAPITRKLVEFKDGRLRPYFPTAVLFCASRGRVMPRRNAQKACARRCHLISKSEQFGANGLRRAPAALRRRGLVCRSHKGLPVGLIAAQDDSMAMGARKAIREKVPPGEQERWLRLPFLGCDGLPETGQRWVDTGELAATVISPSSVGLAVRLMAEALRVEKPAPECTFTVPSSYPSLENLSPRVA